MSIAVNALVQYGLSKSAISNLTELDMSIVDLIRPTRKSIEFVGNGGRAVNINNAKRIVSENDIQVDVAIFDSVYMLRMVGLSLSRIEQMFTNGITNISQLSQITECEFKRLLDLNTNSSYHSVKKKVQAYEQVRALNTPEIMDMYCVSAMQTEGSIRVEDLIGNVLLEYPTASFDEVYHSITRLIDNLVLVNDLGTLRMVQELSLSDVCALNFEHNELVMDRLMGDTLENVGNTYALTRERVRQIVKKVLYSFPRVVEDRYASLFVTYNMSEKIFVGVFNEPVMVYQYLKVKYGNGTIDPIDMLLSTELSSGQKLLLVDTYNDIATKHVVETIAHYMVRYDVTYDDERHLLNRFNLLKTHDGVLVTRTAAAIFDTLMAKLGTDYLTNDADIEAHFVAYCEHLGANTYATVTLRGISDRSEAIIKRVHGEYRYYNYSMIDDAAIAAIDEMFDITDGIYGVEKIYTDNLELMYALDVRNGYELANLCNTIGLDHFPRLIDVRRLTELQIGVVSKDVFISDLLEAYAGQPIDAMYKHMDAVYGLSVPSYASLIGSEYREYLHNGVIHLDYPSSNEKDLVSQCVN